ncbi:MAG: 2-hydroxyacid dehydrogenase [Actinobacteria bacterium]|nr:2-hydroxyacid dehydrogenase [Actinomycetota bacterium]
MKLWLPHDSQYYSLEKFARDIEIVNAATGIPHDLRDVEFIVPPMFDLRNEFRVLFSKMPSLKVIHSLSAGIEDLRTLVPKGVTLCNSTDAHHTSTAEMALALILASLRGIDEFARKYDWKVRTEKIWQSLADKRVLIIGYGSVGQAIDRRLSGFECEVVKVARHTRDDVHSTDELPALLPISDVVVIALPHTSETEGLADAKFFSLMRNGALFVNVSRGATANTVDLVAALSGGRISAALDVTDPEPLPNGHPLFSMKNVLITPHVAGRSTALEPRLTRLIKEQVKRYMAGQPLKNIITGDY